MDNTSSFFTRACSRFVKPVNTADRSRPSTWVGKGISWSISHKISNAIPLSPAEMSAADKYRCSRIHVANVASTEARAPRARGTGARNSSAASSRRRQACQSTRTLGQRFQQTYARC